MLSSIFGLILALGILVTVHEYGHFWVARRFGVKVLRFSVGFGQPIWKRVDRHGTEFTVAWIPLGGYVKMLDEREGDVPADQLDQAFTQKKPYQKIAIALAGPVANVIFAVFAFALMYSVGVRDLTTVIDAPLADSLTADIDIQRGDEIRRVDGQSVDSFADLSLALAARIGDSGSIALELDRNGSLIQRQVPITSWLGSDQSPNPVADLGLLPMAPRQPAVIGLVEEGGAAESAGLLVGDVIMTAAEQPVEVWLDWVEIVRSHPGQTLPLLVQRNGGLLQIELTPGTRELDDGTTIGYVGAA